MLHALGVRVASSHLPLTPCRLGHLQVKARLAEATQKVATTEHSLAVAKEQLVSAQVGRAYGHVGTRRRRAWLVLCLHIWTICTTGNAR